MLNNVTLIGRLGHAPSLKSTNGGKSYCTFSLVTDSGFGDTKHTDWHNIVAWGKDAESCKKYLDKGALACVVGRIQYDTYEKDGEKKTRTQIVASRVVFLTPKGGQNNEMQAQEPENDGIPF